MVKTFKAIKHIMKSTKRSLLTKRIIHNIIKKNNIYSLNFPHDSQEVETKTER